MTIQKLSLKPREILATLATVILLQSCSQVSTKQSQPIKIDGSSTVHPITEAVLKQYQETQPKQEIKIEDTFSGTRGGFRKFCAGETDINAASRPISAEEMKACDEKQVRYIELPIAFDALTVVVNHQNNWADSITVEELKKMWEPQAQGKIKQWQQVRSSWPKNTLNLFGPGKDSGTFDYFTEAIVGEIDQSRTDYVFSEDDEALVNGISQDPNALGYFGYAYYQKHQDKMKAVAIDNGKGPVAPSRETVEKAEYQPLARPLFIYVNAKAAQDNPLLENFVEYYLKNAEQIVDDVGYIPLPAEGYHLAQIHFQRFKVGTVFEGQLAFNLTIGELLRKQAKF